MKQEHLITKISDLLLQFSKEVKDKGELKLYDINIIAEDVLIPILSIAFDTKLKNLNEDNANFPGIDLATDEIITYGDSKNKIAFQITSSNKISKIKNTLKGYVKGEFYKKFDEIYIYNLVNKQKSYQVDSITEISKIVGRRFNFDIETNVIDRIDLRDRIKKLTPISKIENICKLLEDQFVYRRKSLLSLEIYESDGSVGYGFSNLLEGFDVTTFNTLIRKGVPEEIKDILQLLLNKYNIVFKSRFEEEENAKFKNLGFNTYLSAGLKQAIISYKEIKDKIEKNSFIENFDQLLSKSFENLNANLEESDFPLINQPIHHPAIQFIKTTVLSIFKTSNIEEQLCDQFIKHYNQNVENTIVDRFGKVDYQKHLEVTKDKWIRENEGEMLMYIKDLAKLGFSDSDDIKYQESYGMWKDVRSFELIDEEYTDYVNYSGRYNDNIKSIESHEKELKTVESLIKEYFNHFNNAQEYLLDNILFLIADFGKGKTSFLKHFASKLAQKYLKTHEGLFPVYINLNEYDQYSNSPSLGVIAYYMAKRFRIDIKDDYFKKKDYFFLIDSLDECGELTETNIDKVVKDIIEIQNLDNINQRKNRIIIASRPIASGLKEQITKYKPFPKEIKNEENNEIENTENYISIYGFKKEQFNDYIQYALEKDLSKRSASPGDFKGLSKAIVSKIINSENIELFDELYGKVLKASELKRPIFAYMIYKLISSNSDFIEFGKVGVYISFLNQLTRDAKHKDDCNYKISLNEEFTYRNILHASALLWQYNRQNNQQTSLTKVDICRTIEEDIIDYTDSKILKNYPEIDSVHFLSHSYLGERENTLHFQHQSFAEILLAEYYLKVFIKYALEENSDVEEARTRLSIGIPTDQTIEFLKGLMLLLKECALGDYEDNDVKSKRRLLIPILASMSLNKHNKRLYSVRLYLTWFEKYENEIFASNRLNNSIIKDFPITPQVLDKIEVLCKKIICSDKTYLLDEPTQYTILFKKELMGVNNLKVKFHEIDKWLALISGNIIGTNANNNQFFNKKINANYLFELLRNCNFNLGEVPMWGRDYFNGIDMRSSQEFQEIKYLNLHGVNFSNSYFKNIVFKSCDIRSCDFNYCELENFHLESTDVTFAEFNYIKINKSTSEINIYYDDDGDFSMTFCFIAQGVLFPSKLNEAIKGTNTGLVNEGSEITFVDSNRDIKFVNRNIAGLKGIFEYVIKKGYTADFITSAFKFVDDRKIENTSADRLKKKYNIESEFKKFIKQIEDDVTGKKI